MGHCFFFVVVCLFLFFFNSISFTYCWTFTYGDILHNLTANLTRNPSYQNVHGQKLLLGAVSVNNKLNDVYSPAWVIGTGIPGLVISLNTVIMYAAMYA